MVWQPIETMPLEPQGDVIIYGKKYGDGDSADEIDRQTPECAVFSFAYEMNGVIKYATTETYNGSETFFMKATLWLMLPDPSV